MPSIVLIAIAPMDLTTDKHGLLQELWRRRRDGGLSSLQKKGYAYRLAQAIPESKQFADRFCLLELSALGSAAGCAVPALSRRLENAQAEDSEYLYVISALANINTGAAVNALITASFHSKRSVALFAIFSLARMTNQEVVPGVSAALLQTTDFPAEDRYRIAYLLAILATAPPNPDTAPDVREALAHVTPRLGGGLYEAGSLSLASATLDVVDGKSSTIDAALDRQRAGALGDSAREGIFEAKELVKKLRSGRDSANLGSDP